jgi:hypothetical protein
MSISPADLRKLELLQQQKREEHKIIEETKDQMPADEEKS